MKTNVDINDDLVKKAMRILRVKTKKEAVEAGLKAIVEREAKFTMAKMKGIGWGWEEEKPKKTKSRKKPSEVAQ